jgi:predicted Zn-ribbon and HTH transcriptional regulator
MGAMGINYPKVSLSSASPVSSTLNHDMKLVTADEKKTVIADFHRAHHILKKQKARIEVQPAGMAMLDYIVLTFVFAENKRRERETRAKTGGGGGGS